MQDNVFLLVGVQKVNFVNDKGETIQGTKIHYSIPPTETQKERGFVGNLCCTKFFNTKATIPSPLECGKYYEFLFGINGNKVEISGFKPVFKN